MRSTYEIENENEIKREIKHYMIEHEFESINFEYKKQIINNVFDNLGKKKEMVEKLVTIEELIITTIETIAFNIINFDDKIRKEIKILKNDSLNRLSLLQDHNYKTEIIKAVGENMFYNITNYVLNSNDYTTPSCGDLNKYVYQNIINR